MEFVDLANAHTTIEQVARLLVDSFEHAWSNIQEATHEVEQTLQPDRISRVAMDEHGTVVGWISGAPSYEGNVWEMHPLVVHKNRRNLGVGRALVEDFEQQVKGRGCVTVTLGTDDESGETSLSGVDLYSDVAGHIANFRVRGNHPAAFYQKLGYVITGVLPDANGIGKPDIFMSKRM